MFRAAWQAMDFRSPRLTPNVEQIASLLVTRGLMRSGDYVGAVAAFRQCEDLRVVNRVVGNLQRRGLHAMLCCLTGEIRVAEQMYEDAQRSQMLAECAWAHLVLCRCHFLAGDYGAAIRSLREARTEATREVPDTSMVVVMDQRRATSYLAAGDLVRAVRLIRALPPSDARALLRARAGVVRQPVMAGRTLDGIQSSMPRVEAERHVLLAAVQMRSSRRWAPGHLRKAGAIAAKHGLGQVLNPADPGLRTLAENTALEYQDDTHFWVLTTRVTQSPALATAEPPADTPLSRGELQLFAVVPSRAKNAEIAQSMEVSITP